ncbi:hypothetical protein [Kitasatospora sp. NPDC054795]
MTEASLADAERRLGRPLPADLRARYLFADGSGDDARGRPDECYADPELRSGGVPQDMPPGLQAVLIQTNAPTSPMDLTPLAAAPHLRRLELKRRPVTDLAPIRDLPVESLAVDLHGGDLTPLNGHRHLRSLDLATTATTDLTPLRTASNLHGLDLSQAVVQDLTVLADFPHLRYPALTGSQWAVLLDEDKVPPSSAAARLAERDASRTETLSWAARLGLPVGASFVISGTLASDGEIGRTR